MATSISRGDEVPEPGDALAVGWKNARAQPNRPARAKIGSSAEGQKRLISAQLTAQAMNTRMVRGNR